MATSFNQNVNKLSCRAEYLVLSLDKKVRYESVADTNIEADSIKMLPRFPFHFYFSA
jgi:hypothetical protein